LSCSPDIPSVVVLEIVADMASLTEEEEEEEES
jgi:hypothetical protein